MKLNVKNIWLAFVGLCAACCLWAAESTYSIDVYPLTFGTQDTTAQLKVWNRLMKYKLFAEGLADADGIEGVTFVGQNIHITDEVGYVGSATGDFRLQGNLNHSVGGPVLFAGKFVNGDGTDSILTGPTRFLQKFEPTFNSKDKNFFAGFYCFDAGYNAEYTMPGIEAGKTVVSNTAILSTTSCADTSVVPAVDTDVDIPELTGGVNAYAWNTGISGNGTTEYIHVPPPVDENDFSSYSYFVESISFSNNSKLYIVMPPEGRLTKVFVKTSIYGLGSSDNNDIVVVSGAEGSWNGSEWTEIGEPLENKDYAGNLLFFVNEDLSLGAGQKTMQGTYISTGVIKFAQHTKFAGQLLAKVIKIDADFEAGDFKYVPFNPPVLDPTALASGLFLENDKDVKVPVHLNKATETGVSFKYCFELNDSIAEADFNKIIGDYPRKGMLPPFCGIDSAEVKIDKNNTEPTLLTEVYLNVTDDNLEEGNEMLRMHISELTGAVLPGNKRSGFFTLTLVDAPIIDFVDNKGDYSVEENSPTETEVVRIKLRGSDASKMVLSMVDNGSVKFPLDSLFKYDLVKEGSTYYAVITVRDSAKLDYEQIDSVYKVTLVLKDKNGAEGSHTVEAPLNIHIIDVNEMPIAIHPTPDPTINENMPSGTVVDTLEYDDIDKALKFRDDVFVAVGGDTTFFSIDPSGVIRTNQVFDYEMKLYDNRDTTYQLIVLLRDRNDATLSVLDTVVIHIKNVNEIPYILTDTTSVLENTKPGTVVDTLKAVDADFDDVDSLLKFTLVEDPSGCFVVSEKGVITIKECKDLDYEKNKQISIVVKVEDSHGGSSTKTIHVKVLDVPSPTLEITEASNEDSIWVKPKNPIYTNESDMNVCWEVNRTNQDCADTILKPGKNVIRKEVCDIEGFEGCAVDSLIVYYSNAAPVVIVSANPDDQKATNIYTIVEKTDSADANIYVNRTQNDILVTVKDSASHKDTSFTVKLNLETLSVPNKTYETLASVVKESVALDEDAKNKKLTPVNGTEIKVSYPAKVAGVDVTVSYMTDNDGEIVKQKVVNDKGKEESIEVITVSYETVINGKTVTVSYLADAATGAKLVKDASGRLMTESAAESEKVQAGSYSVTYEYKDASGNTVVVTYFVDEKGSLVKNSEGNTGYEVSYTYENQYGNSATQSVFIVLDQVGPKVEIITPVKGQVIRSNFVKVVWTVDGLEQDSLTLQGLEKGKNSIKRIYRDKAGNEAVDSVVVIMKDSKDVDISVEQPVTEISKDKVEKFYAENPPKEGQTFAVSIRNPGTGEEVETLIGGDFKTTAGSGKAPYSGETTHLGPTLALDVKLPVVSGVGGLATLDDLLSSDGLIPMEGVDADGGTKMTVEEYVQEYCEDDVKTDDLSRVNLYKTKLSVKIWVYTTLGNFVDYFSFGQDMNDPDYTNDAGMLQMFFELKPDKDGYVRAENGKMMGTGAYLYKVEASIKSHLRCTLPSKEFDSKTKTFGANAKKKGDSIRSSEDLLKPFGYKRPSGK